MHIYQIYIYIQGGVRKPGQPSRRPRGRISRTLYRKINECTCKLLTG